MQVTETADKLLEAAQRLMLSKGYAATTVDEICAEAGVSKGSFYHFFKTKEELGLATLERFHERGAAEFLAGPFRSIEDPLERALGFVDHTESKAEHLWAEGCLLGSFAAELADTNPAMQAAVSRMFDSIAGVMATIFEPIASRAAPDGPGSRDLAEMYLEVLEGAIIVARAHKDPSRIPQSVARFREYVRRLVD